MKIFSINEVIPFPGYAAFSISHIKHSLLQGGEGKKTTGHESKTVSSWEIQDFPFTVYAN